MVAKYESQVLFLGLSLAYYTSALVTYLFIY